MVILPIEDASSARHALSSTSLMRPVADGFGARSAATTEWDDAAAMIQALAILPHENHWSSDEKGAVAIGLDRRFLRSFHDGTPPSRLAWSFLR